jgi:hypothetical protein
MDERIYTERKMLVGVAIGGPLAGGYYFWRTLNAFGKPRGAIVAAVGAIVVLAITVGSIFIPGLDRLPNFFFYALQFGLVIGVTRSYLLTEMTEHIAEGKADYGWGNTILVAIISMVITLGPLIALIYTSPASFDRTTTRSYGRLKHEIVFDPSNLTELEVGHMASALTSAGFFDEEMQKTVDVAKSNDRFIITLYCTEGARSPEFMELCKKLRSDVQQSFPANPIVIDLVIDTPENRIARLE